MSNPSIVPMRVPFHAGSSAPSAMSVSATAYIGTPIYNNAPGSRPSDGLHGHSFTTTPCSRIEFYAYPRESAGETVATTTIVFVITGVIFMAAGRMLSRAVVEWARATDSPTRSII